MEIAESRAGSCLIGDCGGQAHGAPPAANLDGVAGPHTHRYRVLRMEIDGFARTQVDVGCTPGHRAGVVVRQPSAGDEYVRIIRVDGFAGR